MQQSTLSINNTPNYASASALPEGFKGCVSEAMVEGFGQIFELVQYGCPKVVTQPRGSSNTKI